MTEKQATNRYYKAMAPALLIYLAACFSAAILDGASGIASVALYALIAIAIGALFITFWAHWRFTQEIDEFLRVIQFKALLFGLLSIMVIATGWGMMETFAKAPPLPIFWLNPIFWVAYAIAGARLTLRERGAV